MKDIVLTAIFLPKWTVKILSSEKSGIDNVKVKNGWCGVKGLECLVWRCKMEVIVVVNSNSPMFCF